MATTTVGRGSLQSIVVLDGAVVSDAIAPVSTSLGGTVVLSPEGIEVRAEGSTAGVWRTDDGAIVELIARDGQVVEPWQPLALVEVEGFALTADVPPATFLRLRDGALGARVLLEGSSAPEDCVLGSGIPMPDDPRVPGSRLALTCRIPAGMPALAGLGGQLAVSTAVVEDALLIPLEAVAGTMESGIVRVRTPTGIEDRQIALGPTDGTSVVVESGLEEGMEILVPAPTFGAEDG